jgi:Xaa-Pro aminopeptidase
MTMKHIAENVRRAQAALHEDGLSAFISDRPEDVAYLFPVRAFVYRVMAESRGYEIVLLPAEGKPSLLTAPAYVPFYRSKQVEAAATDDLEHVLRAFAEHAAGQIATPLDTCGRVMGALRKALGKQLVEGDPVMRARIVKSPREVEAIRLAAAAAESGMAAALEAAGAGARECDAAGAAEAAMRQSGADAFCFSTIVSSGPELGLMREVTSSRVIQEGDWVMIDLGCSILGYNAEFARTRIAGLPDARFAAAYRTVAEAQRLAIELIRPGVKVREVDAVARQVIADSPFSRDVYAHITGHGIGTGVWEPPFIGPHSDAVFAAGMVVCIEPGVFIPEVGGIRIEDVVLVTPSGSEVLTKTGYLELAERTA